MNYEISEIHDLRTKRQWHERFRRAYDGECIPFNLDMINGNVRLFVAAKDGRDLGYIRINDKSNFFVGISKRPVWNITEAYVKPPYRSQGVLRELIQYVVKHCNVEMLHIETDRLAANAAYYQVLGFNRLQHSSTTGLAWVLRQDFHDMISKSARKAGNDNENTKVKSAS